MGPAICNAVGSHWRFVAPRSLSRLLPVCRAIELPMRSVVYIGAVRGIGHL